MAQVKIDTGAVEATAFLSQVPREKWRLLVGTRKRFLVTRLPSDCRELLRFYEEAEEMWSPLGYSSRDDLIVNGLGLDTQDVSWALDGLRRWKPNEAVPFEKAIELGKHGPPKENQNASKNKQNKADNVSFVFGNSADYLTARIARDRPDILRKMKAGEYKSVRAAAIDAGIVKVDTPLVLLKRAWVRASQKEQKEFLAWVKEEIHR